ncbi:MAG: hypothetical protein ACI89L_002049 [Phycisphaerales bacterium]|jgi:hypothetical protein
MNRPHFLKSPPKRTASQAGSLFDRANLDHAERITALTDALTLAARPELDHLAVELAELAIPPDPVHPADLSPRALLHRRSVARRIAEASGAYDGLVAVADRLPERIQHLVVAISHQRLAGSIDRAVASGHEVAVRSGLRLIERNRLADASPALRHVLLAPGHPAQRLAAHAAFELARNASAQTPSRRRTLEATLADLAWGFESHASRHVLLAAMLLITPTSLDEYDPLTEPQRALRRLLTEPDWPGHAAIRSALRHTPIAELRAAAWRWLRIPQIANASLDRVTRADSTEEHEALLPLAHLALAPARARVLRLAASRNRPGANLGQLIPEERTSSSLHEAARLGRVRLVSVFNLGSVFTRSLLENAPADDSPRVRFAAVTTLGSGVTPAFLADEHRAIARTAMTAWSLVGIPGSIAPPTRPAARARLRTLAVHRRSEHPGVRRLAREDYLRQTPWLPTSPSSRLSARRWLGSDAASFMTALTERLARAEQPAHAINAITLARRLGLLQTVERELLELARSCTDWHVLATAVSALGKCRDPEALAIIDRAMTHEDPRVRANALEARVKRVARGGAGRGGRGGADLMQADEALHAHLFELKDQDAHRVRAGAVRALLEGGNAPTSTDRVFEPKAVEELGRMLDDERPMHRVSGLWVAQRVLCGAGPARLGAHWPQLAEQVTGLASDADPGVRLRATRCSSRLLAELRQGPDSRLAIGSVGGGGRGGDAA